MAISFVSQDALSQNGLTGGAPNALTPATFTAGNLLVLAWTSTQSTLTTVTDNTSNTWIKVPGTDITTFGNTVLWYVKSCVGGATTISVTPAVGSNAEIIVTEFTGADPTTPLVPASGNTTSGTGAPIGPDLTPTATGQALVSVGAGDTINYTGVDAPWVGYVNVTATGGVTAYDINPPVSVTHAVFEPTTSQGFVASGAVFQAASGGGPSAKQKASMNLVF